MQISGHVSGQENHPIVLVPSEVRGDLWQSTGAGRVVSAEQFLQIKKEQRLHVVNVNGDQTHDPKSAVSIAEDADPVAIAENTLRDRLSQLERHYGGSLVVSSTGLSTGVPGMAYRVAAELGVKTLSVVADQDREKDMVATDFLIPGGVEHGDSANTAAEIASSLILLGGGGTERMQLIAGARFDRPVTIVRGFAGASQSVSGDDLPKTAMLAYCNPLLKVQN